MVITSDPYPSAGYQQQAYVSQGGWYPETGYHQSQAQGWQMGYNKPSPPHTSHQMMVDGGQTYQHDHGYKPETYQHGHGYKPETYQQGHGYKPETYQQGHGYQPETYQHDHGFKPGTVVSSDMPTHTGFSAYNVPGVPGKVQAVEYSYGTGWSGNRPQFPGYGQYPSNGYSYWSVKGV